jgi:hypothetical protein
MPNTFKNAKLKVQTTDSDVYECPSATTAIVIGMQISNVAATSKETTVWWTDASASNAVTRLVKDVIVPAKAALAPVAGKLVLEAGDKVRALCTSNDDIEVTVSVLEIS